MTPERTIRKEAFHRRLEAWAEWRDKWEDNNPEYCLRFKRAKRPDRRMNRKEFQAASDKWDMEYWLNNPEDAEITGNTAEATAIKANAKKEKRARKAASDKAKNIPEKVHARMVLRTYGISGEQYQLLLRSQQSACAVCKTPQSKATKRLAVDHCHETGKVRGLLCSKCNLALGLFGDSINTVRKFMTYLENPQQITEAESA